MDGFCVWVLQLECEHSLGFAEFQVHMIPTLRCHIVHLAVFLWSKWFSKVDGGSDFILLSFFNLLLRSDETLSICDFQFSLVSTIIPRHLELDTYFIILPFKLISCRGPVKFVLDIIIISVLSGWIDRLLFLHHLLTSLTNFCRMQETSSTVFPNTVRFCVICKHLYFTRFNRIWQIIHLEPEKPRAQ